MTNQEFMKLMAGCVGIAIGILIGSMVESHAPRTKRSTKLLVPDIEIKCEGTRCDTVYLYKINQ